MRLRVLLTLATIHLAAVSLVAETVNAAPSVHARFSKSKKKEKKAKKKKKKANRATLNKKIRLSPKGLRFGMSVNELSAFYKKVLEKQFVPLYKRTQPGPRMKELDAELDDRKQLIKRNHIEFGNLPSGLDNTPLGQEFTYNNGESMTKMPLRSGVKRYFFFFNDRLWKIYDIHQLKRKSKLGRDFESVVENLTKRFGKKPRQHEADPSVPGRQLELAEWTTDDKILRILDHGGNKIAVVYIDRRVEESLDKHRKNKGEKKADLDSDVASVTKKGSDDDDKDKKKKKKKK